MPNLTLASAPITNADQLIIELVTPPDAPATILIRCRISPTVGPPSRFDTTRGGRTMRMLAAARMTLTTG